MFDIGIYCPKISITLFYWTLIPRIMGPLRNTLLGISVYLGCAMAATILTDTFICIPFSDNWSIENQLKSTWNSYAAFVIQWCLNFSTELLGMPRSPSRPDNIITNSQRSLFLSILPAQAHRASQGAEARPYRRLLPGRDHAGCLPFKIHRLQCDRL
jgi:hypothetical protein